MTREELITNIKSNPSYGELHSIYNDLYLEHRATGRSYRIANEIIDDFFKRPIGSKIYIRDHYSWRDWRATEVLAKTVAKRIENDFPNIKFEVKRGGDRDYYIVRKTETYSEMMEKRFNELVDNKLLEINAVEQKEKENKSNKCGFEI